VRTAILSSTENTSTLSFLIVVAVLYAISVLI
jgi:hypothetical protein